MKYKRIGTITEEGGEAVRKQQIPESAFEQELLRRVIASALPESIKIFDWKGEILATPTVGDKWGDGWLPFTIEIPHEGDAFGMVYLRGEIRVLENPYPTSERFRLSIDWKMPKQEAGRFSLLSAQANYLPYLPIIYAQQQ